MAGPTTEVLNSELKELREAVNDLRVTMAEGFGRVDGDLKEIRRDISYLTGFGKWFVGIQVLTLAAILGSAGGAIWYLAKLDSRVGQVEQHQAKAEAPKR